MGAVVVVVSAVAEMNVIFVVGVVVVVVAAADVVVLFVVAV